LIEEGLANSPQVSVAMARIRRAEAEAQRVGAARMPTIGADAEGGLRRQSGNNGIPAQFLPNGWQDYGQTSLSFGFDLDLWGRNRAAYAAATSDARAAVVDAAQARLVLSVAITAAYAELGRHHREHDTAAATLSNRRALRNLVGQLQRNGLDNLGSLRRADAEVAAAEQDLAAADENIGIRRNQLAALVGSGPDRGQSITRPALAPSTPGGVPAGVTTDLLGRRPDIVAARERVEAAASRIKVARASFFPSVNVRALVGLQALGLGNLVDSGSLFGSVGPAISLPIFQGGALKAQYGSAEAAYDEAVANYNQTVVTAYQQSRRRGDPARRGGQAAWRCPHCAARQRGCAWPGAHTLRGRACELPRCPRQRTQRAGPSPRRHRPRDIRTRRDAGDDPRTRRRVRRGHYPTIRTDRPMSDTATQAAEVDPELSAFRKARRTMWLKRLAIALAIAELVWGAWYVLVARNYVSTDNAYVNARWRRSPRWLRDRPSRCWSKTRSR
jgi:NodT family efflux transporter outer membrane factor (OMF) lipoprotein